ncbi:MAG: LemA family protein [Proteobacteria bacterium]|nr:LemA family protein [Pseudomonadota bacterium]
MNTLISLMTLSLFMFLSGCGVQSIPTQSNEVEAAWSEVLNQYQRRADLVPNLVNLVKGYAKHEKETLESVISARAKATQTVIDAKDLNEQNFQKLLGAQNTLSASLSRLMVVAEQYPDLKANQNFRDLQVQLEGTENRTTIARQRYIEEVKKFNNLITVFPTSITNSILFHHSKKPQWGVGQDEKLEKAPEVQF